MNTSSSPAASGAGRSPLLFLMATSFLFATGIGLVLPVLPFIVARYVPDVSQQSAVIGWLGASFALCAFVASPVLGALSDAYGRKPVLLLGLLGSGIGYLVFGLAGALWMLFVGRVLDGVCAGGMSASYGYVADTTPEAERGAVFARIGAVTGAGLVLGPAIGGALARIDLQAPVLLAAAFACFNVAWGWRMLPESLPPERRSRDFSLRHLDPLTQLHGAFAIPAARRLIVVGILFMLPFSLIPIVLPLFARDAYGWGAAQVGTLFTAVGICDVLGQGVLLPRLLRRLGERRVALLGMALSAAGMLATAGASLWPWPPTLYLGVIAFALGEGMFTASMSALVSMSTPADLQGRVQGGAQACNALAQVAGPVVGGQGYARLGAVPTFGLGTLQIAAAWLLLRVSRIGHDPETPAPGAARA